MFLESERGPQRVGDNEKMKTAGKALSRIKKSNGLLFY